MKSERRLRIKTMVVVLAMVMCANAGDLMLKRGMSQIGPVRLSLTGLSDAFGLTVTNGISDRLPGELYDGIELCGL
jgi:hypothetical protein